MTTRRALNDRTEIDDEQNQTIGEAGDDSMPTETAIMNSRRARQWMKRSGSEGDSTESESEHASLSGSLEPVDFESAESQADPTTMQTAPTGHSRRANVVSLVVVPLITMGLAGGVAYLKYVDSTELATQQAGAESVQTAKDTAVAMLSYTPDTADQTLNAARDRLTGAFRDSYSNLIHDVVIPGAKQQSVTAVASVPAAAIESASPDHAVVLVYVNQAITMGNDAPTQTNSVVQVTLERSGSQWLVSGFDPK